MAKKAKEVDPNTNEEVQEALEKKEKENVNPFEDEIEDIFEGEPVDVPIDESFYQPQKVKIKQIAEDGTLKTTEFDLKRKKANLKTGLDSHDVAARKAAHWDNINDKKGTRTVGGIILSKILTIFNLLCIGIAIWLISVGAFTKCFFIIIVLANIIIGIVQDLRAKAMIDKLSILSAPTVNVLRDGQHQEIEVKEIVLDDIMLLNKAFYIASPKLNIQGRRFL